MNHGRIETDWTLGELERAILDIEGLIAAQAGKPSPWFMAVWGSVYLRLKRERQRRMLLWARSLMRHGQPADTPPA